MALAFILTMWRGSVKYRFLVPLISTKPMLGVRCIYEAASAQEYILVTSQSNKHFIVAIYYLDYHDPTFQLAC